MRRTLLRGALSFALAGGIVVVGTAGPAWAGKPAKHACVGETFATAAAFPLGQLVRGFAQAPDDRAGLGDGIQTLQAGQLPDSIAGNACN
jgi:hypothetical protein